MDIQSILLLLVLGSCTGFLAGLFGIGGGMIMVPFVTVLLEHNGVAKDHLIQIAIASSLATILFTSISSVRAHHGRGSVLWRVAGTLAPGIVVGSILGAQIAGWLDGRVLATFFGLFVAWQATKMMRAGKPGAKGAAGTASTLPGSGGMFAAGSVIGVLSALLGAGGAFLTVPFLSNRGVSAQQAVGTSAACGFPVALAGTVGYIIAGWHVAMPAASLGFIHLPTLLSVSAASVLTAPLGARAAHALPTATLKRLFGWMLMLLAAFMLWKAAQGLLAA